MKKSRVASNSICLSAICACAMMAAVCLIFGMTPFGNNTFLTGDLNGIYINFYAQMRAAFLQEPILTWEKYLTSTDSPIESLYLPGCLTARHLA